MHLLLIGYGKMGKAIEKIALARGHHVTATNSYHELTSVNGTIDVAIEFTHPESAVANIRYCFSRQWPVVCGTTGWLAHKSEIETECRQKNSAFFYASNFSLGVNVFFKVNEFLGRLMSSQRGYDVSLEETHHTQKKDAPSGTAITLAEGMLKYLPFKKKWALNETSSPEDLVIRAFRVDPVPGTHVVRYHSAVDDIEIKHTAHSREGFAFGAVMVAEWIKGKQGVYTMDDFLKL